MAHTQEKCREVSVQLDRSLKLALRHTLGEKLIEIRGVMQMGLFREILSVVLENEGGFFTSGLRSVIDDYYETKRDFTILTLIIGVVCLVALFIRALLS